MACTGCPSNGRISAPCTSRPGSSTGHTEIVYLARVEDLPDRARPPLAGLSVRRSVGINGCRLSAVLGPDVIGYMEVETFDVGERLTRTAGRADVGNFRVSEPYRRRGMGSWLLGQAADWLRLAHVDRLLDYAWLEGTDPGGVSYEDYRAILPAVGFRELTRTQRGWTRSRSAGSVLPNARNFRKRPRSDFHDRGQKWPNTALSWP
jgi:GNAT superfamily N-acetyltransferase